MAIIGALPVTLTNGTVADATQVMQDFSFIVSQTNTNAAALATTPQLNLSNTFVQPQIVGAATGRTHAPRASQVQDGAFNYLTGVAGGNAITANASISPGAYVTGAIFWFIPAGTNTGAATLNINTLGAQAVQLSTQPLTGGELRAGKPVGVMWSGAAFQIMYGCWGGGRPLASYVHLATATTPADVLLCAGQSLAQVGAAADLFARIGTTYGSVGAGFFNVPDCKGRVVIGKDDMGGAPANRVTAAVCLINGAALGAAGGDQNIVAHIHTVNILTDVQGNHQHNTNLAAFPGASAPNLDINGGNFTANYATSVAGSHQHNVIGNTGSSGLGASANVQPSIVGNIGIVW